MASSSNGKKQDKRFVYRNIIILSLAACLNFTGFSALQNLQSSFNPKLGFNTLCILYATYALTLLFLPNLAIYKVGYKWTFVLSVTGYATFTLVQFYPTSFAMAISAICVGQSSHVIYRFSLNYDVILTFFFTFQVFTNFSIFDRIIFEGLYL